MLCPCRSGKAYGECCERYHKGVLPENALVLMRSRYSAYALHLAGYIMTTTHPLNPQKKSEGDAWREGILSFSKNTKFEDLEILEFNEEGNNATVTFIASLSQNGKDISFKEKSRFEKVNGRWLYLDGVISPP